MSKRGKQKYQIDYRIKDIYNAYKKDNPKDTDYFVDYSKFSDIVHKGFSVISDEILNNSQEVFLPHNTGTLSIIKRKNNPKRLAIDYKTTKEVGQTVYYFNDHSRGYSFRWRWRKQMVAIRNRPYYSFVPTRYNKRKLAKEIFSGQQDYFQV